jgi:hypothetical protein
LKVSPLLLKSLTLLRSSHELALSERSMLIDNLKLVDIIQKWDSKVIDPDRNFMRAFGQLSSIHSCHKFAIGPEQIDPDL